MNTESPTTAKPKRQRTQAQKDAHAKKERERRQRNAVLKGTPQSAPGLAIEPAMIPAPHVIDGKWQSIDVDGETIKVKASLPPAEAEKVARNLVEARKPSKDVERVSPVTAAKAAVAARKSAKKLPAGHAKFALSTSAYGVLLVNDLSPSITKALKASDKIRSATKAANLPYHFPVMTLEDTAACADCLAQTAKVWEKRPASERDGNLASVKRYAAALREISKGK